MVDILPEPPYGFIANGLKAGEVIPFFGAAASAIYRPSDQSWAPGKPFMPFGSELATILAKAAGYPLVDAKYKAALAELQQAVRQLAEVADQKVADSLGPVLRNYVGGPPDLALIASWAEHVQGTRRDLDRTLRQSFLTDCQPGRLHKVLADIPGTQFYVTTNYDDLLEKALEPRHPHVIIDRGETGLWVSVAGREFEKVDPTGRDLYDRLDDPGTQQPSHPIIFKIHGSIDRRNAANDRYLITEEDYVDFLGRLAGDYVSPYIGALMEGKKFLFLGYSLEDWNIRVILRKLLRRASGPRRERASEPRPERESETVRFWAIVRGRSEIEQAIWRSQSLNIYPTDLCEFAEKLAEFL